MLLQKHRPDDDDYFLFDEKLGLVSKHPASFDDWIRVMQAGGRKTFPPMLVNAARYQTAQPDSFTVWKERKGWHMAIPLLLGGMVHLKDHSEAWLVTGPAMKDHMLPLVRWGRAEIKNLKNRAVNNRLVTTIQNGHKPGQRMATLLGFTWTKFNNPNTWELR